MVPPAVQLFLDAIMERLLGASSSQNERTLSQWNSDPNDTKYEEHIMSIKKMLSRYNTVHPLILGCTESQPDNSLNEEMLAPVLRSLGGGGTIHMLRATTTRHLTCLG